MFDLKLNNIFYKAGSKQPDPEKPTLVFIHGAGVTSALWDNQVDQLAGCANTIALDLPAHGNITGEPEKTISGYAGVVEDFIDALELPDPVPCGLSMGGGIVQTMLAQNPAKYRAGILINTGAKLRVHPIVFETLKKSYSSYIVLLKNTAVYIKPPNKFEFLSKPILGLSRRFGFEICKSTPHEKVKSVLDAAARENPDTTWLDLEACKAFDIEADQPDKKQKHLADITAPVLIISALKDTVTPPKNHDFLAEKIPNSTLVHIKEAGHLLTAEKPIETNIAIAEFLKNL